MIPAKIKVSMAIALLAGSSISAGARVLDDTTPTSPTIQSAGVMRITNYSTLGGWRDGTITRSGTRVRPGVVAVDPRVIPLGTKLRIEGFSDITFIAEDTGGGIKGAWVDIFRTSHQDAVEFGMQYLEVWIVEDDPS